MPLYGLLGRRCKVQRRFQKAIRKSIARIPNSDDFATHVSTKLFNTNTVRLIIKPVHVNRVKFSTHRIVCQGDTSVKDGLMN